MNSLQKENTEYENKKIITLEESPPMSSEEQPQKVDIACKKKQRRFWKRVRRQIHHIFSHLFYSLLALKERDPSSRAKEQFWVCGSLTKGLSLVCCGILEHDRTVPQNTMFPMRHLQKPGLKLSTPTFLAFSSNCISS